MNDYLQSALTVNERSFILTAANKTNSHRSFTMRKVTFGGAVSLDLFLARTDHAVDWLLWCDEAAEVMKDYWKSIDAVLMGRKTYDIARRQGQSGGYPGIANYVFSRTLTEAPAGFTLVRDDPAGFVRKLKTQPGKDICLMGGGEIAHPLLEAGLIDEIGLNIHPILLGSGIPLFYPMKRQIQLQLLECRPFKNGCLYATYKLLAAH
jgi:dihydrofolate reductase